MCGICGVVDFGGAANAAALVRRMTPAMTHRGPDDEGYLTDRTLALGMRRLSIIDLEGGHQPIFNEDGSVGVVLNGEIYNFQDLKKTLERMGHSFRTRSDSEVIAHAYEEWGSECVQHLQGMFAIAIYDRRAERREEAAGKDACGPRLFLARDRLGIKPLYYYCGTGVPPVNQHGRDARATFLFASEVRTLLASGIVPRRLSHAALESYLFFGSVSEPMTLVEGVLSLPPGHSLTINLGSPAPPVQPEPYWNIATADHRNGNSSEQGRQAATARVRRLLEESVRLHLIADVPVGVFLSGGIDSTAIAALASRETGNVHTFTVAFEEERFSEAPIARRTAKRLGTNHEEMLVNGGEMLARLDEAIAAFDQPSMDALNTYFVSWAARQAGLKVALSGLGGDEVFGGYPNTFHWTPRFQRLAALGKQFPASLRSIMAATLSRAGGGSSRGDAARKIAAVWNDPESLPHPYYFVRAVFTPSQVAGLLNEPDRSPHNLSPWWNWLAAGVSQVEQMDSFSAITCLEARGYLVNTLLRDTDFMSMAHSLEVRVPFLHHPLVEFVTQLPESLKLRKGTMKALLVEAVRDLLPAEVLQQAKRGFTIPLQTWLRGPLKERMERGFSKISPALLEAVDAETFHGVWQDYLNGHTNWSRPWSLYVLNEWTKRHIDQT